jgi:hypothetical protein
VCIYTVVGTVREGVRRRRAVKTQVILLEATEVEEFDARGGGGPRLVGRRSNRSIARAVVNGQRKRLYSMKP